MWRSRLTPSPSPATGTAPAATPTSPPRPPARRRPAGRWAGWPGQAQNLWGRGAQALPRPAQPCGNTAGQTRGRDLTPDHIAAVCCPRACRRSRTRLPTLRSATRCTLRRTARATSAALPVGAAAGGGARLVLSVHAARRLRIIGARNSVPACSPAPCCLPASRPHTPHTYLLTLASPPPTPHPPARSPRQARDQQHERLQLGRGQPRLLHPSGPHGPSGEVRVSGAALCGDDGCCAAHLCLVCSASLCLALWHQALPLPEPPALVLLPGACTSAPGTPPPHPALSCLLKNSPHPTHTTTTTSPPPPPVQLLRGPPPRLQPGPLCRHPPCLRVRAAHVSGPAARQLAQAKPRRSARRHGLLGVQPVAGCPRRRRGAAARRDALHHHHHPVCELEPER